MIASFDIGEKNFAYCIATTTTTEISRWVRIDITSTRKKQTILESCARICDILESEDGWNSCDLVLIEQQMLRNVRAQRLSQHVWTWFRVKYPNKSVMIVPSSRKTQYFLGKNTLTSKERKTWSVKTVTTILTDRNDVRNLRILSDASKKDDLCDAFLQLYVTVKKIF